MQEKLKRRIRTILRPFATLKLCRRHKAPQGYLSHLSSHKNHLCFILLILLLCACKILITVASLTFPPVENRQIKSRKEWLTDAPSRVCPYAISVLRVLVGTSTGCLKQTAHPIFLYEGKIFSSFSFCMYL